MTIFIKLLLKCKVLVKVYLKRQTTNTLSQIICYMFPPQNLVKDYLYRFPLDFKTLPIKCRKSTSHFVLPEEGKESNSLPREKSNL